MSVTSLVGTKWLWDSTFPGAAYNAHLNATYSIDFYSYTNDSAQDMTLFNEMQFHYDSSTFDQGCRYLAGATEVTAFVNGTWNASKCKIIEIVGGVDAENPDLIALLESNAEMTGVYPVVVEYNGVGITAIREDGSKILQTANKVCADNIKITYTAPGGGSISTANVTIENNTFDALYYTDSAMAFHAVTSGSKDLNSVPLPVGSIVVCAREGAAQPSPFPMAIVGLTQRAQYTVGTKGLAVVYEVTG